MQPFIKWAGGKRWLAAKIEKIADGFEGRYFEPFLGGGAVFFHLRPKNAVLSDVNGELITTYRVVRDFPNDVIEGLERLEEQHSDSLYYKVRAEKPANNLEVAIRFLYLNRTCWNGLYRVNRKGEFNVPRGTKNAIIKVPEEIHEASLALRDAELSVCDFEETIAQACKGDLIYVDPPYTVKHNFNGFLKYNEVIFGWDDQIRLRDACKAAQARGATVIISNADHESISELYATADAVSVSRASVISGKASGRAKTTEFLGVLRGAA